MTNIFESFRKWTLFEPYEQKVSKVVLSGGLPDNPGELVYTVYDALKL